MHDPNIVQMGFLGFLAPIAAGLSIAKSIFGKKDRTAQESGGLSPFATNDDLNRYLAMKDILRKTRNPYYSYMGGERPGPYEF